MRRNLCLLFAVLMVSCAQTREQGRDQPAYPAKAGRDPEEQPLTPVGKIINFEQPFGPGSEHVVNVDKVKVFGRCSKEELEKLVRLVSKLQLDSYDLLGVEVVWDDRPLAAMLFVGQNVVYCTKNTDNVWEFRGLARVNR